MPQREPTPQELDELNGKQPTPAEMSELSGTAMPPSMLGSDSASSFLGLAMGPEMQNQFNQWRAGQNPEDVSQHNEKVMAALRITGNLATAASGGGGVIPAVGMNLIQRGLQGQQARELDQPGPDPLDVGLETGAMALMPPMVKGTVIGGLKAAKAIGTFGGKVGRNLLSRFAGVGAKELETAIANKSITNGEAPKAFDVVSEMRDTLGKIKEEGIPEYAKASEMLKKARPVRVGSSIGVLERAINKPVGPEQRAAATEIKKTVQDIAKAYGSKSSLNRAAGGEDIYVLPSHISPRDAEALKRTLQGMAKYEGRVTGDPFNTAIKRASASLRSSIENSLPSSSERYAYRSLMSKTANKMDVVNKLTNKVGEFKDSAENFVRLLTRSGKTEQRALVQKFDKSFGTNFLEKSKLADTMEAFGGETPAYTTPRFTATGSLLGPGLGATVGGAIGGIPGGMIGAGIGLAAGSPRGAIAAGRGVNAAENALRGLARMGGKEFNTIIPFLPSIAATLSPAARDAINNIMGRNDLTEQEKSELMRQELSK